MTTTANLAAIGFSTHGGINGKVVAHRYKDLSKFYVGKSCLEMGSADGATTPWLLERFEEVVAVDGSETALQVLKNHFGELPTGMTLIHSLFEDLNLGRKFDTILMGHILEHVDDPTPVIQSAIRHLAPKGVIIASVPNGNSIHRHLGVELGQLNKITELNEADHSIGHQRVFMPDEFRMQFTLAGLKIKAHGGHFIKPFSNGQLEKWLSEEQIQALINLGSKFPEIAADIYVVCSH